MINKILIYGLLFMSSALIFSCSTNKAEENINDENFLPEVSVIEVKTVEYSEQIRTTGRLSFNNEYKLSFKTGGIVEAVYVKEGQRVRAGKLLATLILDEIEAKTSQANIAVEKAERDYNRIKELYADSVATLEQLQNAESQLQSAQHDLQVAQFNQSMSKIVAPSNGVIQKILVKENEITGAGNPIIVFGAENQGKVLIANISDVDVVKIEIGDKATLNFDAFHETEFTGKVIEIAGMADPTTGTYEVKIQVNDPQNQLKSGFIGSAIITSSKVNRNIEIPIEAMLQANSKTGVVYKIENDLAIKQNVHIIKITNDKLLISSGLSENDKIVVEGFAKLKGDSISVKTIH
ncbi:MAG: efflux RND transporter periplasmic adaptor subunit [Bacteroidales bacterium]|nr:efflux RND transporter periplasmic adaptor subunit [Bacteroidales bacterium]